MTAHHQPDNDNLATIGLIAIGGPLIALGGLVYVASWLASGQGPGIRFDDVMSGVVHLPATMGDPAAAFPEPARSRLPGPHLYWGIHIAALVLILTAGIKVILWSAGRGDGLDKRRRLDVDAQPRFATPREMRSERLPAPTPGRFPYARMGRRVIATHRHEIGRKTRTVPGALALVGPSRSGKSHSAIIGTQLWQGPAIISSVKTDLIAPTLDARQAQGEVRVYDPSRMTPMSSASWSPLRDARSLEGAQRSAKRLLSAVQLDRTGHGTFWSRHGETLLGGLMWLAANTRGLTMTDVARWVLAMDQPSAEDPGKAASFLRALATDEGIHPDLVADVQATLAGIWRAEGRVSSSFYTSARHAVMPWTRNEIRRLSETTTIDLDWLTSGNNTLYLAAPLMDQDLLAPAFGGLIADLVDQVILRHEHTGRALDTELLLLLDETANVPLAQLPHWASTVAGYGIQLVTVWQSKAQIDAAYGPSADTVIANHLTQVYFPGIRDLATIRYVSELLGTEHQPGYVNGPAITEIHQFGRDTATGVPLVPSNVLRQLGQDDRLVITNNKPPAHAHALDRIPRRWRHLTRPAES
ncbi:MAG: type IV secretory system conjugative DNA transfer family protein [Acidimicrobiales bacterium]